MPVWFLISVSYHTRKNIYHPWSDRHIHCRAAFFLLLTYYRRPSVPPAANRWCLQARGVLKNYPRSAVRLHIHRRGLLPTIDISPLITLISCGSSSILVLRMNLPTRVIRGSFTILQRPICFLPLPFFWWLYPVITNTVFINIHYRRTGFSFRQFAATGQGTSNCTSPLLPVPAYWFFLLQFFQLAVGTGSASNAVYKNQTRYGPPFGSVYTLPFDSSLMARMISNRKEKPAIPGMPPWYQTIFDKGILNPAAAAMLVFLQQVFYGSCIKNTRLMSAAALIPPVTKSHPFFL